MLPNQRMEIFEMKNISQQTLFEDRNLEYFTIEDSAKIFMVSTATIRNWIKTGYLKVLSKGKISRHSIENFKKHISGIEKLNQRANKLKKDTHDHKSIVNEFLEKIQSQECVLEKIGEAYENSLSDSYRNQEGIYYTPNQIVNDLLSLKKKIIGNETFCDPCCGSGNFIIRALDIGFKVENIFGFDIDPIAVEITKKRIQEKTGYQSENIKCADFLQQSISQKKVTYDYIYTNPPWGKKIDKIEKDHIRKVLNAGNSLDTCSLFYFACINALKLDGILGLLLPDAFFNVAAYEDARLSTLTFQIEQLSHYGKAFKGLLTNTVGIVLHKKACDLESEVDCTYESKFFKRKINSLHNNPKSIFNISCTSDDAQVIEHIYSIPHITLIDRAKWGLGIITGNNTKYIENCLRDDLIPIYKGSDITKHGLKPASNFIPNDFSLYQQVAPINLYEASEKLIYKFISSKLCFFHDTASRFVINSANILITEDNFPIPMKTLCDLFNSNFINWVFSKIFNTHKILRGDLELLPIHDQFLSQKSFIESDYLDSLNIEMTNCGNYRIKR